MTDPGLMNPARKKAIGKERKHEPSLQYQLRQFAQGIPSFSRCKLFQRPTLNRKRPNTNGSRTVVQVISPHTTVGRTDTSVEAK